ncbi:MAG: hypothetical protein MZV70_49940 [Desulfobacterales bacterium]|nr:hypothetical protein [Desulfobacterales bacterium]
MPVASAAGRRIPLKHAGKQRLLGDHPRAARRRPSLQLYHRRQPAHGRPDHCGARNRRLRRREFHFDGQAVAVKHRMIPILAAVLVAEAAPPITTWSTMAMLKCILTAPQAQSVVLVIAGDPFQKVQAPAGRLRRPGKSTLNQAGEFKYFYMMDGKAYLPDCRLEGT